MGEAAPHSQHRTEGRTRHACAHAVLCCACGASKGMWCMPACVSAEGVRKVGKKDTGVPLGNVPKVALGVLMSVPIMPPPRFARDLAAQAAVSHAIAAAAPRLTSCKWICTCQLASTSALGQKRFLSGVVSGESKACPNDWRRCEKVGVSVAMSWCAISSLK